MLVVSNAKSAIIHTRGSVNKSKARKGTYGREKNQSSSYKGIAYGNSQHKSVYTVLDFFMEIYPSFRGSSTPKCLLLNSHAAFSLSASFYPSHDGNCVDKTLGKYRAVTHRKPVHLAWLTYVSNAYLHVFPHNQYWHMGS